MKIFHTADWHLGKLVQGVYMTEDQSFILDRFIEVVKREQPDCIIVAGDIYDRAVPPTEAVQLFDRVLNEIILDLQIPVLAIAGNHDSPSRLHFASNIMEDKGLYIVGKLEKELKPVVLKDADGEVHFHLIPYCDPSTVRNVFQDDAIKSHDDAMKKIVEEITRNMDKHARHVFVGHAFVTPYGESEANTSDSERPLAIGGTEYVNANHFNDFHYTALGHLHRAHAVLANNIRYAGSPLKYSISEELHEKGFYIVQLASDGEVTVEKQVLTPRRDMYTVSGTMEEILQFDRREDYVFVHLLDETPVLAPMEKVRSVFPNAMHVERKRTFVEMETVDGEPKKRFELNDVDLFKAFYKEVKGIDVDEETETIFKDVLDDLLKRERETEKEIVK